MLAIADASWAGIPALVNFGMANAAMIRMIVTTMSSSISVNPRSRLRLVMKAPSLVSHTSTAVDRSHPRPPRSRHFADSAQGLPLGAVRARPRIEHARTTVGREQQANYCARTRICQSASTGLDDRVGRKSLASQHASESRVIFKPFRFPSTVTAIDPGWKNSAAEAMMSSADTAWMRSMISSMLRKRS